MTTNTKLKLLLSILFILCLFDMPYGYFQFVRAVGMVGFLLLAKEEHDTNNINWRNFYLASAFIINPIIKLSLGRGLWNALDIVWAIILLYSLYAEKNRD